MKVIFLDCDGVLNSEDYAIGRSETTGKIRGYGGHFREKAKITHEDVLWQQESVNALRSIVDATDAKIVISSTWRNFYTIPKFVEMFAIYGWNRAPIIDKTIDLYEKKNSMYVGTNGNRGLEIAEWLNRNDDVENYVILDDISQFLPDQEAHFVNTFFQIGLTKKDAEQAIIILNNDKI